MRYINIPSKKNYGISNNDKVPKNIIDKVSYMQTSYFFSVGNILSGAEESMETVYPLTTFEGKWISSSGGAETKVIYDCLFAEKSYYLQSNAPISFIDTEANCIITMSIKGFEGLDQPMPKTIMAKRGKDNFGISEGMLEIVVPDITEYIEGNYSIYLIDDTQKKILNKNFFYLKDITQSSATICFVYLKKITCSTNVKVDGTEGGKSYWFDVSADRSFSAFATSLRPSKEEMVIGMGKNPFSLNSNDFFQSGTRKALSSPTSIGEDISLDILSEYENGLETATLRCEVGDYFYNDGEKAISIDNDELPMTFDNGMTVIPMIRSPQGVDVPMSVYSSSGNAKKFRIVGISMIYDGAVWQQITIKEIKE